MQPLKKALVITGIENNKLLITSLKVMKTVQLLFITAIVAVFASSCIDDFTIHGNGVEASEERITTSFSKVKSEGSFDVHITQGDDYDILVSSESNILQYIETSVHNQTLRIYIRGVHNIKNQLPLEVYITTPRLEGVTQSGSGSITSDYFSVNKFNAVISGSGSIETAVDAISVDAAISGSGNLTILGNANDADFSISGSGRIYASDLELRDCNTKISGSGNAWVNVERFLKANISGSGSIFYIGTPEIERHISGSGKVIPNENKL